MRIRRSTGIGAVSLTVVSLAALVSGPVPAGAVPTGSTRAFTVTGQQRHVDARTLRGTVVKHERTELPDLTDPGATGTAGPTQTTSGSLAAPAPILNVKGLDYVTWGDGHPPDTNGAIGPNHFVQSVNTSIGMFDKATGNRVAAFTFNDFFAGSGTAECDANNGGDPTVIYDVPSGRWVIADFAWLDVNNGPFYECVAVSSGSDPVVSTWTFYSIPAGDGNFPDYPKFGSGPDGVYFTINNFHRNHYVGAAVYALQRASLGTTTLKVQHATVGSKFFSLQPVHSDTPVAGAPEYIASVWNSKISLWAFRPDWTTPANSTFALSGELPVSYSSVGSIPTPGESVDSLSPRVMNLAQLRNGSLWLTHTVAAGTTSGVRWYEVTGLGATLAIRQQGTYAPADGTYRWMPALAVDKQGNMAVGYNVGSKTLNPAIRYAGRLTTDPLGTLGQGETSLIAGTGSPSTGNFGRWGDYAQMTVDPTNGCTFWFTTEYYAVTGNDWQTRIGSFQYPGCA